MPFGFSGYTTPVRPQARLEAAGLFGGDGLVFGNDGPVVTADRLAAKCAVGTTESL